MQNLHWLLALGVLLSGCSTEKGLFIINTPPAAAISSHQDGDTVYEGEQVLLMANVSDVDNAAEQLALIWMVNGATVCLDSVPNESGVASCTHIFEAGTAEVSLEVKDPGNEFGQAVVSLTVIPNEAPVAAIVAPLTANTYLQRRTHLF